MHGDLMDEAVKARLLDSFSAYLDGIDTLDGDGAERDANAASAPDLFTLLAELSALGSEVKLQARQFKTALEELRTLSEALSDANARADAEQTRRHELEQAAEQRAQQDLLLELIELRDRLGAGHEQALRFRPGWFGAGTSKAFVGSMAEGMAINLRRLDETLARRGVRRFAVLGRPFDPHRMHAAELARDPSRPVGEVVKELRRGYLHHDKLLRPADVMVNRPTPAAARTKPQPTNQAVKDQSADSITHSSESGNQTQ